MVKKNTKQIVVDEILVNEKLINILMKRVTTSYSECAHKGKGKSNPDSDRYQLEYMLIVLQLGCAWRELSVLKPKYKPDTIRKKYNRFVDLGIFDDVNNELLKKYDNVKPHEDTKIKIIDSTDIINKNAPNDVT